MVCGGGPLNGLWGWSIKWSVGVVRKVVHGGGPLNGLWGWFIKWSTGVVH